VKPDESSYKAKPRKKFYQKTGLILAATSIVPTHIFGTSAGFDDVKKVPINAHLWVYASKFMPNWDCSPILDTVFSDLNDAGIHGLELMEANLRHDNSVKNLNDLLQYTNGDWTDYVGRGVTNFPAISTALRKEIFSRTGGY